MTKLTYLIVIITFASMIIPQNYICSQVLIEKVDCENFIASLDHSYLDNSKLISGYIENEISKDVWKKSKVQTSEDNKLSFKVQKNGNFRVTLILENRKVDVIHNKKYLSKKQLDSDEFGAFISDPISISCIDATTKGKPPLNYTISPNPFKDELHILFNENNEVENMTYIIYDITGKKCAEGKVNAHETTINTVKLIDGPYTLSFLLDNNIIATEMVIK